MSARQSLTQRDAEGEACRVQEVAGKGLGLVAVRRVTQGEVVLDASEDVLLQVEVRPNEDEYRSVTEAFDNLSEDRKGRFFELSDKHELAGSAKTIMGIYSTNSFSLRKRAEGETIETGKHIVYGKVSRLNHSCDPQVAFHFKKMIAIRDIEAGEELCFSYIGSVVYFSSTEERRKLLASWKFTCQCVLCSRASSDPSALQSDQRRHELRHLRDVIRTYKGLDPGALDVATRRQLQSTIERFIDVADAEQINDPWLMRRYFLGAVRTCDDEVAKAAWSERAKHSVYPFRHSKRFGSHEDT